jgi:hypothetical protein
MGLNIGSAGGLPPIAVKPGSTARINTTTLAVDPDLQIAFAGGNRVVPFTAVLLLSLGDAMEGFQIAVRAPADATIRGAALLTNKDPVLGGYGGGADSSGTVTESSVIEIGATTGDLAVSALIIKGVVIGGGCAPGQIAIWWAQDTADDNAAFLEVGSSLSLT